MTREEIGETIKNFTEKTILCELSTGVGKSKIALDLIHSKRAFKTLIVYPKLVLKKNWIEEIHKWGYDERRFVFTTYASLKKHARKTYNAVIYDECHHISELCAEYIKTIKTDCNVLLSATVSDKIRERLESLFDDIAEVKIGIRTAIDNNILPDPKIYLLPLRLNTTTYNQYIIKKCKNKKIQNPRTIECSYKDRFSVMKKNILSYNVVVKCTQWQYYDDISNLIQWHKKNRNTNQMLHIAKARLEWLALQKTEYIKQILDKLKDKRTITFCANIEHTEVLGTHCINSKNKKALETLDKFNNKEINHITAVQMLNEGCNLNDCQIGIFGCINASETIIAQKQGRLLRHKEPIIIIPYFINTREAEIVELMCHDYNKDLITKIENIEDMSI